MKTLLKLVLILALLSLSTVAQTTIVEYTKAEPAQYPTNFCAVASSSNGFVTCGQSMEMVTRLDKFNTLEEAMQFMADHQDYTLLHFYSALTMLDVKVEEKKTSEPQPPIEKTEKVYKFGSLTKKKTKIDYLRGGTGWITTVPYSGTVVTQ